MSNPPADGDVAVADPLSSATAPVDAKIGGVDAAISFLGLAPDYVGLAQANILVPDLPTGVYPLVIIVGDVISVSADVFVSGSGTPAPVILTSLSTVGIPDNTIQPNVRYAQSVYPNGDYVYICNNTQIAAVNVSNPAAPALISTFGIVTGSDIITSCTGQPFFLFAVLDGMNAEVFDLTSSATQPELIASGQLNLPGTTDVVFSQSTAVVSTAAPSYSGTQLESESGYVEAYDLSNYANPLFADTYSPPSNITNNAAPRYGLQYLNTGTVAVLGTTDTSIDPAAGEGQFTVLDVSDATSIQTITEVEVPGTVVLQSSAIGGTIGLIAGNTQGIASTITPDANTGASLALFNGTTTLTTVDFSNIDSPAVIGTFDTGLGSAGTPNVVSLGGSFFAVSIAPPFTDYDGPGLLAVVDATDPQNPIMYRFARIEGISGMAVQNGILYVTTSNGVSLYSITLPS